MIGDTHLSNFSKKWNWVARIDSLADGDILKWDAVTSLPVGMAFLKMTLDKDKNEAIENDRRIQERASGVN